ncbi:MAG: DUF3465 domain-containing protein [Gemmatimonadales bacterium]
MTRAPRRLLQAAATAVVLLLLYVARSHDDASAPAAAPASPNPAAPVERPAPAPSSRASSDGGTSVGGTSVAEAFRSRRSHVEVETGGRVVRVLPDDREGSRHERFLVRVDGETTVLVAHNLDLADRIPLAVGDSIELRGEYEWNPKGGVIHWTHRDPDGRHRAGWIRYRGRLYQ